MSGEDAGHLCGVNAHAVDLHVVVQSPQDIEHPIPVVATAVSAPVQQVALVVAKGICQEAGAVAFRIVDVTPSTKRRPNDDFPGLADTTHPVALAQDEHLRFGQGPSDGLRANAHLLRDDVEALGKSRFGGAIQIDDRRRGTCFSPTANEHIG